MITTVQEVNAEVTRLTKWIADVVPRNLRRRGAVLGLSGGVDSATTLHLTVRALGAENVVAMFLPERDTSPESRILSQDTARALGVDLLEIDLTSPLSALACYERRDRAIAALIPDYHSPEDRVKIVLPGYTGGLVSLFTVVAVRADGRETRARATPTALREIVAASNMKQRLRMLALYAEAERRDYCVVGTANRDEHELGFFVKYGDSGVDLQPIQHLFKTDVYRLADFLGVAPAIRERPPTTDTYSAECTQEEFFFRAPFEVLDAAWQLMDATVPEEVISHRLGLPLEDIHSIIADIHHKQTATDPLRFPPLIPPSYHNK